MSVLRYLLASAITVLGLALLIGSGGGGGGGDDNSGSLPGGGGVIDDPVTILPTYNMILADLPGENPLTANVGGAYSVALDFDDDLFFTTINLDVSADNSVTLLSYEAQRLSGFNLVVSSDGTTPLDATLSVTVDADIAANVDEAPTSGALSVLTPEGVVGVNINGGDVVMTLNGAAAVSYTWSQFEDLLEEETAPVWQRQASLAANALGLVYELFVLIAERLDELEAVTLNNPTVASCDMFTGTPPLGVMAQGETGITWLGSGQLSDDDDFLWEFTDCWLDDPLDDTDSLFDGSIDLQDYTETVDTNTNTLFEIGFGSISGRPGGIIFDLEVSETEEANGAFTIAPEDVFTLTGGFAMIIQQF